MTFLHHIWASCSGFRTYRQLINLPVRTTVVYWLIFSAFLTAVFVANVLYLFGAHFPQVRQAAQTIPSLVISNGMAYSEWPQPYVTNTNHFPVIVDLEDRFAAPEKKFARGIIVHKKEFHFWLEGSGLLRMPLASWPNGRVDPAYFENLQREVYREIPLLCGAGWMVFIAAGMLQALFFSGLINILESTMKPRLTFRRIFNIAVFALTPGAIIAATYVSTGISMVLDVRLIYLCCYCFFLVMTTGVCRIRPDAEEE